MMPTFFFARNRMISSSASLIFEENTYRTWLRSAFLISFLYCFGEYSIVPTPGKSSIRPLMPYLCEDIVRVASVCVETCVSAPANVLTSALLPASTCPNTPLRYSIVPSIYLWNALTSGCPADITFTSINTVFVLCTHIVTHHEACNEYDDRGNPGQRSRRQTRINRKYGS